MRERVEKNRQSAVDRLGELETPAADSLNFAAHLRVARRMEELNCPPEDVIAAYERAISLNPADPEALLAAARYCRLHGDNDRGAGFAELGLGQTHDGVRELKAELLQELSITANYSRNPLRYALGHAACEWLALSRDVASGIRSLASDNLLFYANDAVALFPTFQARRVNFSPPAGYTLLNPSVARLRDGLVLIQRTANYWVSADGRFYTVRDGGPVRTRNFLLAFDDLWDVVSAAEVLPPADMPPPVYEQVLGLEDMRLFARGDELWISATVREANTLGLCEQFLARIELVGVGPARLVDWRVMRPEGEPAHEKNWMPWVSGNDLRFLAFCDPTQIRDGSGKLLAEQAPPASLSHFRGGSQLVNFDDGWLAIVHEVTVRNDARYYLHRFVRFDASGWVTGVSPRFYFHRKGIEFVAGLAWHPDGEKLIVSFGVGDEASWLATLPKAEVEAALHELAFDPERAMRPMRALTLDANVEYCGRRVDEFAAEQTNKALREASAITFAASALRAAGLPVHPDRPKAWDSFLAIHYALRHAAPESAILDAGAGIESSFLPSLAMLGYRNLTGINLLFKKKQRIGGVTYEFGDITNTSYPGGHFSYVACLSVVEHGVDVAKFLAEMARILCPGGFLFVSVDYWEDPVDTSGVTMFDAPFTIFDAKDANRIIERARAFGLELHGGSPDFKCDQKLIENVGLQYTFANFLFAKTGSL